MTMRDPNKPISIVMLLPLSSYMVSKEPGQALVNHQSVYFENFEHMREVLERAGYFVCDKERVIRLTALERKEYLYWDYARNPEEKRLQEDVNEKRLARVLLRTLVSWIGRRTFEWLIPGGGSVTEARLTIIAETPEEVAAWKETDLNLREELPNGPFAPL